MKKEFIRKLRRVSSHSYSINIPKELVREWGWQERQKLVLKPKGRKAEFTVKDWPARQRVRSQAKSGGKPKPKPKRPARYTRGVTMAGGKK